MRPPGLRLAVLALLGGTGVAVWIVLSLLAGDRDAFDNNARFPSVVGILLGASGIVAGRLRPGHIGEHVVAAVVPTVVFFLAEVIVTRAPALLVGGLGWIVFVYAIASAVGVAVGQATVARRSSERRHLRR